MSCDEERRPVAEFMCESSVVRVRCRRKESPRSLSHLLTSFLFISVTYLRYFNMLCSFRTIMVYVYAL